MEKPAIKKIITCFLCLLLSAFLFGACANTNASSHRSAKTKLTASGLLKEQKRFDSYLDGLFTDTITGSTINLHYTVSNPSAFGIEKYDVSLGEISEASHAQSAAALENIQSNLEDFDYGALSLKQQLIYDVLSDYTAIELDSSSLYLYDEILRPSTGTQSELPILLAEYHFYTKQDIEDYLALLSLTDKYFDQIISFEEQKAEAGLFMSDFAVEKIIEECKDFTADPETNYLLHTFESRIAEFPDLSDQERSNYIAQNKRLVIGHMIPAYENLLSALTKLKGQGKNEGGLCNFRNGKEYYEYLVRTNTGSDKSIKQLQEEVEEQRTADMNAMSDLITKNPKLVSETTSYSMDTSDPEKILNTLIEVMQKDFPSPTDKNFTINYVDSSLEEFLAPAFYLTAPIDDTSHNVIYINKSCNYSKMQLFTTLAHEGFPGHLYQTTSSYQAGLAPVRAMLNYPGYVEGWATYVEMMSYQYADLPEDLSACLQLNQSAVLSLYATIDLGIHYDGWDREKTEEFLTEYGFSSKEVAKEIYELVVEEPSHYLKYYIGYLEFSALKKYAMEKYGQNYSNRAFHQALLTIGPAPFFIVKDYLNDYYTAE